MMKACRLVLISAVILGHPLGAAGLAEATEDYESEADGTIGMRQLKHSKGRYHHHHPHHHHGHSHHKAIQDMYAEQETRDYESYYHHEDDFFNREDDYYHHEDDYYGHSEDHDHEPPKYYDIHFPEYLDEDIKPRPFQNCIPESFHEANQHGKTHHHKGHHKHHKHGYGGLDHHHHKHTHKGNFLGDYNGIDEGYYSKAKGAKGKGKGGGAVYYAASDGQGYYEVRAKSSKSSKSSKSKGYYYRQRNLQRRGAVGIVRGRRRGHRGGRNHRGRVRTRAGHTTDNDEKEAESAADGEHSAEEEYEDEPSVDESKATRKYKDGRNHHAHAHTHKKGGLPLCPNVAPPRRTFGPIPTIAPREPTPAPAPTVANATLAPSVAQIAGEPIPEDAGPVDAPAEIPADAAPVDIPPGTERVLLQSAMNYGLFEDATPREPTMEEIDGVLQRTSMWYEDNLKATAFPNLDSFEATFVDSTTDLAASEPIKIDFDANAFFPEGSDQPTPTELFMAMEALDYQDYIMSAVWTPDMSGGIFEQVQLAGFTARVAQGRR